MTVRDLSAYNSLKKRPLAKPVTTRKHGEIHDFMSSRIVYYPGSGNDGQSH